MILIYNVGLLFFFVKSRKAFLFQLYYIYATIISITKNQFVLEKYIFIGGGKRGFLLAKKLVENKKNPEQAFILEEDKHEVDVYSDKVYELFKNCKRVRVTKKLNEEDYLSIQSDNYSFAIVCGWRTIINLDKIEHCFKIGLLAAHDSLLPKYRGFAPTNWAMINGEKECGVSIFKVNNGEVDSGPVYYQESCLIDSSDTINEVMTKVTDSTIKGYLHLIDNLSNVVPFIQNETEASYTCKRSPLDGEVDWNNPSIVIYNLIRALSIPYPNAFSFYKSEKIYISKAKLGRNNVKLFQGKVVGKVIGIYTDSIEILCDTGTIEILEIRDEASNIIPFNQFQSITQKLG
jgi:methionyl-tRNA formyltransferase